MDETRYLLELQDADLRILRTTRKLDELPEKARIMEIRDKRKAVCKQRAQVVDMADDIQQSMEKLRTEDAELVTKADGIQAKLEATKDYRLVTSLTRELEGCMKRREKIAFELGNLKTRADKTAGVEMQAEEAVKTLDRMEEETIASYRRNGAALQTEMTQARADREQAAAHLSPQLLARYTELAARKGGIAVGELQGRMCSICHVEYQEGQLLQIGREGAIATCPNCHRLLVVDGEGR